MVKGEIAHYEQFLPLTQCFQLIAVIKLLDFKLDFTFFCLDVFEDVSCRFDVYGKVLNLDHAIDQLINITFDWKYNNSSRLLSGNSATLFRNAVLK